MEKARDYYVYAYIDPATGEPFYVGKGRGKRVRTHLQPCHVAKNLPMYNRLRRMLEVGQPPQIRLVATGLSESESLTWETFFILALGRLCDRSGPLMNLTIGGEGLSGRKHSPETKVKMSLAAKGRVISKEARVKMSEAAKNRTEETKKRIAVSRRGIKRTEETKRKMSASRKGHIVSAETGRRISVSKSMKNLTRIPAVPLNLDDVDDVCWLR